MLKLSSIKAAPNEDGVWQDVADWPGVRLKVRSINYGPYQIQRELLVQKLTRKLGRMPTSPEMEPQLGALIAKFILRDWDGIANDEDKALPYSPELGHQYCTDPELQAFETQVILAATRAGASDAQFTTETEGN